MNTPKVSICIPAYKQPEVLKKALDSVFKQNFKDFEVIITDDSPDDSVYNVVKGFSEHKNLKYFKNESIQGSPGNWNAAVSHANGEYIKILHHDDWFLDAESLGSFVKLLDDNPDSDFAFCGSRNYDESGQVTYEHQANPDQIAKQRKDPTYVGLGNFIGAPSATIYRRRSHQDFDINLKWYVDVECYIRILAKNPNFTYTTDAYIGILDSSPHRVTASSVGNMKVVVGEFIYLYDIVTKNYGVNFAWFRFLWHLLEKTRVTSVRMLRLLDIKEPYPQDVYMIFNSQDVFLRIMKFIRTIQSAFSIEKWLRLISVTTTYISVRLLKRRK